MRSVSSLDFEIWRGLGARDLEPKFEIPKSEFRNRFEYQNRNHKTKPNLGSVPFCFDCSPISIFWSFVSDFEIRNFRILLQLLNLNFAWSLVLEIWDFPTAYLGKTYE